jgi:hypothetical protein
MVDPVVSEYLTYLGAALVLVFLNVVGFALGFFGYVLYYTFTRGKK